MALNERGHEVPDPTPVEISTTLRKPESMEDMIRRFVRVEGSRVAAQNDQESFEEANDFEPEETDEDQMDTVYTVHEMTPELNPDGFVEKLDGATGAGETTQAGSTTASTTSAAPAETNPPQKPAGGPGDAVPPAVGDDLGSPQA